MIQSVIIKKKINFVYSTFRALNDRSICIFLLFICEKFCLFVEAHVQNNK